MYCRTDDECSHHASLTACYQLAQSVEDRSCASRKGEIGKVGGHSHTVHMVAVLAWPFLSFFTQRGIESTPL